MPNVERNQKKLCWHDSPTITISTISETVKLIARPFLWKPNQEYHIINVMLIRLVWASKIGSKKAQKFPMTNPTDL